MTHDSLEIRRLRYFLAVAEAGSFSRAADRLGLASNSGFVQNLETRNPDTGDETMRGLLHLMMSTPQCQLT